MTSERDDEFVRVLDEGDGVELLVYLVTAARTQVDEAAEYAPMRLLTAAGPAGRNGRAECECQTAAPLARYPAGMLGSSRPGRRPSGIR
jgi:Family of unknown function (DUF6092)